MVGSPELADVIGRTYDCVLTPDRLPSVLNDYARATGGETALLYLKPRSSSPGKLITSFNFDPSYRLDKYLSYYEPRSPLIPLLRNRPEGRIFALGDYAFSRSYRETEYFQDWVRPQRFGDFLGSHLVRNSDLYVWLSIRRSERRGIYAPPHIRAADVLAQHLARAIKLRQQLETRAQDSIQERLNLIAFGVCVVDEGGRILETNREADRLLTLADGLRVRHGRLACTNAAGSQKLDVSLLAARQANPSLGALDFSISRKRSARPLIVQIIPLASDSHSQSLFSAAAKAIIFLQDPLRPVNIQGFVHAYHLTAAEARVLSGILEGVGLTETAHRLRISTTTARTHLQHIFEKTQTNTQADLVRLVLVSSLHLRT